MSRHESTHGNIATASKHENDAKVILKGGHMRIETNQAKNEMQYLTGRISSVSEYLRKELFPIVKSTNKIMGKHL